MTPSIVSCPLSRWTRGISLASTTRSLLGSILVGTALMSVATVQFGGQSLF